ncbi:hypothetical protein NLI96_g4497 [Meripilus lineatus]|uniref:Uncharacterized protein n=1 Tax=Meripilus lineatus TaxID=2056292 RepID=A0AAD5V9U4_9APHY|nr:hypothetical protein NLI96_g4497 [Physisporinus lineatus]
MAEIIPGGTYKLTNAKTPTLVLNLSDDRRSIAGGDYHSGSNQQWQGEGYYIRSLSGSDKYLAVEGNLRDGLPVIATDRPAIWDIRPDEEDLSVQRIYLHNTVFNVDLANVEKPSPGTVSTFCDVTNL